MAGERRNHGNESLYKLYACTMNHVSLVCKTWTVQPAAGFLVCFAASSRILVLGGQGDVSQGHRDVFLVMTGMQGAMLTASCCHNMVSLTLVLVPTYA